MSELPRECKMCLIKVQEGPKILKRTPMECLLINDIRSIFRLISASQNCHNFLSEANFLYLNIGIDSMYHAESGDIKVLVQCQGNSILKTSLRFEIAWVAAICVGVLV